MSAATTEEQMVCYRCDGELIGWWRWGFSRLACPRCGWEDVRAVRLVSGAAGVEPWSTAAAGKEEA